MSINAVLYFAINVFSLTHCVALLVKNDRNSITTLYCYYLRVTWRHRSCDHPLWAV